MVFVNQRTRHFCCVLFLLFQQCSSQSCRFVVELQTFSQDATVDTKSGKTVQGPIYISDTTTTDVDPETGATKWPWCRGPTTDEFKGRWFAFQGTGGLMTVSTCSNVTDFEHDIAVKTTCDASRASCVVDNKERRRKSNSVEGCTGTTFAKEFSLLTQLDQVYYVFVKSTKPKQTGNFGISITDNELSARRIRRCVRKAKKHCKCHMRFRPCIQQVVREHCRFSHTYHVWHRERRIAQITIYRKFEVLCAAAAADGGGTTR